MCGSHLRKYYLSMKVVVAKNAENVLKNHDPSYSLSKLRRTAKDTLASSSPKNLCLMQARVAFIGVAVFMEKANSEMLDYCEMKGSFLRT